MRFAQKLFLYLAVLSICFLSLANQSCDQQAPPKEDLPIIPTPLGQNEAITVYAYLDKAGVVQLKVKPSEPLSWCQNDGKRCVYGFAWHVFVLDQDCLVICPYKDQDGIVWGVAYGGTAAWENALQFIPNETGERMILLNFSVTVQDPGEPDTGLDLALKLTTKGVNQ